MNPVYREPVYREPSSLGELFDLLAGHGPGAVVLAGGTDLFPLSKWDTPPAMLVGLKRIAELRGIRADPDAVWIGAMTTHRAVECSGLVRARLPVLAETFAKIGSVRIRNQATIGGNLARADPAWDPPPTLIALEALAVVAGPDGQRREVRVDRLLGGSRDVSLRHPEVILGVRVPVPHPQTRALHVKVRARSAAGGPIVAVAAAVRLAANGRIGHARLALGAVGATAVRACRAEEVLDGSLPTQAVLRAAAGIACEEIDPVDDLRGSVAYKRDMARVWVERVLTRTTT